MTQIQYETFCCRNKLKTMLFFGVETAASAGMLAENIPYQAGYAFSILSARRKEMASQKNAPENSFSLTLFDIYRKKDLNGPLPESPTFTWTDRNGASQQIPFLQPVQIDEGGEKSVRSALHRLYPLARSVFRGGHVFRTVPQVLLDELNTAWQLGNDLLPVCFPSAGGFCLEEEYLLLYLEVQPLMPGLDADCLTRLAVMLTSRLCCRETARSLVREFKAKKEDTKGRSQQEVVQDRFQGNSGSAFIRGLSGEAVTVREIFADLAGPGWESMLLDRFLLKSLLITPVDEPAPAHSRADEENLVRLARGMNDNYLPAPLDALAGHVMPVQTFANVLFLAANEGVAGHVKPAPEQEFLRKQFPDRYRTEYTLLFILAVYQHYRLIDLFRELAEQTEGLNENGQHLGRRRISHLRQLRQKLAVHEVKYFNAQPAFLTNYQQYYNGLRQGLNTGALVEKLRRSVAELDALLDAEERCRAEAEQHEKKKQEEQHVKGEMILAVTAEMVALPYYLLNLLEHIHLGKGLAVSVTCIVTVGIVAATLRTMWRRTT
jgi:hypothetical protein